MKKLPAKIIAAALVVLAATLAVILPTMGKDRGEPEPTDPPRIVTAQQLAADHVPASLSLFLLGAAGFLVLLAVMAFIGILLIRRKSILALIQGKQK